MILGGAGFLGSHLAEALLARGRRVRIFDRENVDQTNLQDIQGEFEFVGGDFQSEADQNRAIDGAETVFHLVSTTIPASSNQDPVFDVETNLLPTVRLLEQAGRTGIKRVLYLSSGGTVYGRPDAVPISEDHPTQPTVSYGVTKLAIEKYMDLFHHLYGLSYRVLRLSNPYGPRQRLGGAQGAASIFLGRAFRGEPITIWGDGEVVRNYVYVTDAIEGILAAEARGKNRGTYNIGSGKGVSLNELVKVIQEVSNRQTEIRYEAGRGFDVPINVLDISRAKEDLDWTPRVKLPEGLGKMWEWLHRTADK